MTSRSFHILRFRPLLLVLASLLVFATALATAQTNTSISGTVTDPQGRVVPGVTLTLTNRATGATRVQTTGESGNYAFELLTPGDYRVEAQARGFKKATFEGVHALIAKPVDLDITLQVGATSEEVTVTAEGGQILANTQDATLGNNFLAQQIENLPIEARNVLSLLTLQPGVSRQGYVAGARSDQSNVTLDGIDINDSQTNALAGSGNVIYAGSDTIAGTAATARAEQGPVLRLNSEAVQEFRVVTATSNATGARSSGAQINLITKSGTNQFHGALFESHRNTIFTANNWFNNHATPKLPRPTLIRNTFGGALGGPVIKNRLFFFYSYEGRRDASQTPVSTARIVPLPSMGQGLLRYPGPSGSITQITSAQLASIFPQVGVNPAAISALAAIAARYPANDFTVGDSKPGQLLNTAGFRFNAPTPVHLNSHAAKLDLNLSNTQTLFARANVIYDNIVNVPQFPDLKAPTEWDHPVGIAVGHTWTIHNTLVNNVRYGLTRQAFSQIGDLDVNAITFRFIWNPIYTRTLTRVNPVHNFVDDLSWVKGKHTFQFGGNVAISTNGRTSFANA